VWAGCNLDTIHAGNLSGIRNIAVEASSLTDNSPILNNALENQPHTKGYSVEQCRRLILINISGSIRMAIAHTKELGWLPIMGCHMDVDTHTQSKNI